MAKNKYGAHTPKVESTMSIGRKRLSDITNTGVRLSSSLTDTCEGDLSASLSKGNTVHLLKEIGLLKKLLAEKESTIETQALEMKKLWINWCRASQQNRQIIKINSEISKELAFDRERLMLLKHEYNQMSAMFKAKIVELEEKANDQLQDVQETKGKNSGKIQDEEELQLKFTFSTENKDSSPCKSRNMSNRADGFIKPDKDANEESLNEKRICLRRRSAKISYKEPSLNKKLRQHDQEELLAQTSTESSCHGASFDGLDSLEKVCEDDVLHFNDVPQSDPILQDFATSEGFQVPSDSNESCQSLEDSLFSSMSISTVRGKASRVVLEPHEHDEQEGPAPRGSSLNGDLEATQPSRKSLSGRPVRKAAETVASYKEIPLNIKMRRPA